MKLALGISGFLEEISNLSRDNQNPPIEAKLAEKVIETRKGSGDLRGYSYSTEKVVLKLKIYSKSHHEKRWAGRNTSWKRS